MEQVDVVIPDSSIGWAITVTGAIVAWLVRLEARLNARPTRQEQEAVAQKVTNELKGGLEDLKRLLEKQNESSSLHRQLVGDSLAEIRTTVAVLRDRAGDDPLEEIAKRRRS